MGFLRGAFCQALVVLSVLCELRSPLWSVFFFLSCFAVGQSVFLWFGALFDAWWQPGFSPYFHSCSVVVLVVVEGSHPVSLPLVVVQPGQVAYARTPRSAMCFFQLVRQGLHLLFLSGRSGEGRSRLLFCHRCSCVVPTAPLCRCVWLWRASASSGSSEVTQFGELVGSLRRALPFFV